MTQAMTRTALLRTLCLALCGFAPGIIRSAYCQTTSFESHSFAYSTGESLHYQSHLAGKPTLVLLHGLGLSSESWNQIRDRLARSFDVYAIDMRGFGQSSKPPGKDYSIKDQALRIASFIERESLNDVILAGHSYGGAVAMMTYLTLKERKKERLIGKLILLSAPAYPPRHPPLFIRAMHTPVVNNLLIRLWRSRSAVRYVMAHTYHDKSKIAPALLRVYASYWRTPGAAHALVETTRQLYPRSAAMLKGRIEEIDAPTLLIWGAEDTLVPVDMGIRLNKELPRSRIEMISGCGHVPQEEMPDKTVQLMLAYLGEPGTGGVR